MQGETFQPIPTALVPPPIVERAEEASREPEALPRILVQSAGSDLHERRLLVLAGIYFVLVLFQAVVLAELPRAGTLVIYEDGPEARLLEVGP